MYDFRYVSDVNGLTGEVKTIVAGVKKLHNSVFFCNLYHRYISIFLIPLFSCRCSTNMS